MISEWKWWAEALDNPQEIGKSLRMSPDNPETGYFKTKRKNGAWEPVVLWEQDGRWHARRSGEEVKERDIGELWNWCGRYPISTEEYDGRLAGNWAGDDPTVVSMIGHNAGDDLEMMRDQIAAAEAGAENYRGISDDEQAGRAQSLRARLNELAGQADKKREELKKPFFEAGKAIDKDWMPLIKGAKAIADFIRAEIGAFETHKLRLRRIEEERQREEQARLTPREEAVVPPPLPPTTLKGSYGRAATVGTERVVTAITDQDALYQHFRDHSILQACLLDIAKRDIKLGGTPPGVTIEERARIT